MSAVCGNAVKAVYDELAAADPSGSPTWPYTVQWSDQGMTVSTTILGNWSGSCNSSGFVMSAQPNTALGITTLSFSFAEAEENSNISTPIENGDDGLTYTMYLYQYPTAS